MKYSLFNLTKQGNTLDLMKYFLFNITKQRNTLDKLKNLKWVELSFLAIISGKMYADVPLYTLPAERFVKYNKKNEVCTKNNRCNTTYLLYLFKNTL